jgi:hypothetical protein
VAIELTEYVKIHVYDPTSNWRSKTIRAVIAPHLCAPLILGLPFLTNNCIVVDHAARTVVDKKTGVDLLNPKVAEPKPRKKKLREVYNEVQANKKVMLGELKEKCAARRSGQDLDGENVKQINVAAAVRQRIECLNAQEQLGKLGKAMVKEFEDVFAPIPHLDKLPTDVYCRIKLKDASQTIKTRSYSTPRKYREAWSTLIQDHLEAGRIRPSSSAHASPAFLIPKGDPSVLPRWVNDYRALNANTVMDSHPLPRVDDILADCAKGKIWSKIDMTNSFFQTRVHPDDVHLTAVSTPLGLYEWLAMPMGLRNAPPIHQRRVTAALRPFIGRICHVYLDDIVIWSNTIDEHTKHIRMILTALRNASLYCNPKKCEFYLLEMDFLGHHISQRGIEARTSKVDKVLHWPRPRCAKEVRGFLGLVRYIAAFLPNLADHARILTPLTTKDAQRNFPAWTDEHEAAFVGIKALVVSRECLTSIDHTDPGEKKIFVTCDASDWRTGAVLSFGETWETARPVAFESAQLNAAEKNYPIHEKELLSIVRALKKWRADLLGGPIFVYTDHRTLQNFETQRDLSRRQLRWQEYLSQYEMTIVYIPGEDNTVADGLSRIPPNAFPEERMEDGRPVCAVLSISTHADVLAEIKEGYKKDKFCSQLMEDGKSTLGVREVNGLWYIGSRLLVPRTGSVRETLFRLAHDGAGHFGADKSYAALREDYYWPNMRRDLEQSYIPSCELCQRNKSPTTRPSGPLHPLPIPDKRGDSVAIDFVGPLPMDEGLDCILSMTDRLGGADIRLVPTRTNIDAEELAVLFFEHWYCENGLPLEIISDRDKLFVSRFWKALHALTGVKLRMSTAYHPQTDGASERTNKTLNQSLRFYVDRKQKGWVRALPKIRFDLMNSVNASSGFSPFQLRLGRSPRLIPPIVPDRLPIDLRKSNEAEAAQDLLEKIANDEVEARDNILQAKVQQAHHANKRRGPENVFRVGEKVMLSTLHRRGEYKKKGEKRAAKFFPRFDGPYEVIEVHAETSNYTLEMPNSPNVFPMFHASELKRFVSNDDALFPDRIRPEPGPIVTEDGLEEYFIEAIIDSRRRGKGWQFLVRWTGYGPEHDRWLAARSLDECEALDEWYRGGGDGPERR